LAALLVTALGLADAPPAAADAEQERAAIIAKIMQNLRPDPEVESFHFDCGGPTLVAYVNLYLDGTYLIRERQWSSLDPRQGWYLDVPEGDSRVVFRCPPGNPKCVTVHRTYENEQVEDKFDERRQVDLLFKSVAAAQEAGAAIGDFLNRTCRSN
jgi:hypothetical protein